MTHSKRRFLTHNKIAKEMGVGRATVNRWMDEEGLKYLYVGGKRRITQELWDEFYESHTFTGPLVDAEDDDD